eukprot:gene12564-6384_t
MNNVENFEKKLEISLEKCYDYLEKLRNEIKKEEKELEGFKYHSENHGWKLYTREGNTTLLTGIINASPKIILSYFEEFDKYAQYDPYFDSGSITKDYSKDFEKYQMTSLCHFKYKGFWPVFSSRDFSCIFAHDQMKDGTLLCPSYTLESDLIPKESGYVRGELGFPSGTIIEELEEGKCRVTSQMEIIMNGWVSSAFMSMMVSESFPAMKKCTDLCEKEYLESKK